MRSVRFIVTCFSIAILAACAPEIGVSLTAPMLPEPLLVSDSSDSERAVRVRVGRFIDARPSKTLVIIDGRNVDSEGALTRSVEDGFERYLRRAGAQIAVLNAPLVEGQVVDWSARVEPGFPMSNARAVARLKVVVRDSRAHPIYHATFSGESTASHPMMGPEQVQELLAQAMGSAIEAAVRDEDFIAQLSRGRIG